MKFENIDNYSRKYIKGHCYSNNEKEIDFNSLELLFLYAKDYKLFKDTGINLNARYTFEYCPNNRVLNIQKNHKFIDLFGKNINLKIFCGENGTGKTTILELINNMDMIGPNKGFIVLKDKNNKFITTKRSLRINYNDKMYECNKVMDSNFTIKSLINDSRDRWNQYSCCTKRNLYENYAQYPHLYSKNPKEKFFDGFELRFFNFEKNIEKILHKVLVNEKLPINAIEPEELYQYFQLNPFQYILLSQANEDFYDYYRPHDFHFPEDISAAVILDFLQNCFYIYCTTAGLNQTRQDNINKELLDYIYNIENILETKDNINITKSVFSDNDYLFKGYCSTLDYQDLLEKANDCLLFIFDSVIAYQPCFKMSTYFNRDVNKYLNICYFKPYKLVDKKRIYPEDLSVGEYARIKMITDLITVLNNESEEISILLNDEIDAHIHPAWAKDYLYEYMNTFKNDMHVKPKIMYKKLNIIMTTHSPFILSDVTNDYVEYLEKQGNCGHIREKSPIQNTFAGNILQMFADNFFLDSTMGKFSKKVLQEVIAFLSNQSLYSTPILLKSSLSHEQKKKLCKKIIDSVGDDILKKMLEEKYERFITNEKNKFNR